MGREEDHADSCTHVMTSSYIHICMVCFVQNKQCTQHKQPETDHSSACTPTTVTAQPCRNVIGTVSPGSATMQSSTTATSTTVIHAQILALL